MPAVSQQQQAARDAALKRLMTMRGWIHREDVETVASMCGLKPGTVAQINKGVKFHFEAVKLLLELAAARKADYEKIAGVPLDEVTGEPIPARRGRKK